MSWAQTETAVIEMFIISLQEVSAGGYLCIDCLSMFITTIFGVWWNLSLKPEELDFDICVH